MNWNKLNIGDSGFQDNVSHIINIAKSHVTPYSFTLIIIRVAVEGRSGGAPCYLKPYTIFGNSCRGLILWFWLFIDFVLLGSRVTIKQGSPVQRIRDQIIFIGDQHIAVELNTNHHINQLLKSMNEHQIALDHQDIFGKNKDKDFSSAFDGSRNSKKAWKYLISSRWSTE